MPEYYMNIASFLYFTCYLPEFYANYINKNANFNNIFEKVVMLLASSFALEYAIETKNRSLMINYAPIIALDSIALCMRTYYAYLNRDHNVKVNYSNTIESPDEIISNPIHDISVEIDHDL